jgi:hypothetical protein
MGLNRLSRRYVLSVLAAGLVTPQMAFGDDFIDLDWVDLLPEGETSLPQELLDLTTDHSKTNQSTTQAASSGTRTDWNGQTVRLPGFIVPLEYSGTGVTAFILVPFVGACVHVPPPPANQLVFVTTNTPYQSKGLYEPVNVIGMFGTSALKTQIAEIAYALSADQIVPYAS